LGGARRGGTSGPAPAAGEGLAVGRGPTILWRLRGSAWLAFWVVAVGAAAITLWANVFLEFTWKGLLLAVVLTLAASLFSGFLEPLLVRWDERFPSKDKPLFPEPPSDKLGDFIATALGVVVKVVAIILVPLGALYLLVRFVKWAWQG